MNKKLFLTYILLLLLSGLSMQSQSIDKELQPIDYKTYIELVWKQNLNYAAEKLNVDIAKAEVKAAKVFNDPELAVEYADNDDRTMQMGRSVAVELSKTFSPGRRSANIHLAESEKELNDALLDDYFHSLRAEATLAYLETIKQAALFHVKEDSYHNIKQLAESDSLRFALGKITKLNVVQSSLEAGVAYNDLIQARSELYNAYTSLGLWTGEFNHEILHIPKGTLAVQEHIFDTEQLLQTALDNRADLEAAMKNVDVAQKALKVTKRERNMEFDLALGYNYNTEVRNDIAPAPRFNGVTVGVAVPLKFSNFNKGAVRAAEYKAKQAEINYRQVELEVQMSVMQSLRDYKSKLEQVRQYDNGLLSDAKAVLDGKIYSYDRGETSLLEVLDAQRTYNELHEMYIETLYNCIASLIELERNSGIWDITIE